MEYNQTCIIQTVRTQLPVVHCWVIFFIFCLQCQCREQQFVWIAVWSGSVKHERERKHSFISTKSSRVAIDMYNERRVYLIGVIQAMSMSEVVESKGTGGSGVSGILRGLRSVKRSGNKGVLVFPGCIHVKHSIKTMHAWATTTSNVIRAWRCIVGSEGESLKGTRDNQASFVYLLNVIIGSEASVHGDHPTEFKPRTRNV